MAEDTYSQPATTYPNGQDPSINYAPPGNRMPPVRIRYADQKMTPQMLAQALAASNQQVNPQTMQRTS